MLGFSSRANWRNCCTARCWSIWYRLFIATLSFSWQKKPPSAHYDRGCESRYFLRINGHPHSTHRRESSGTPVHCPLLVERSSSLVMLFQTNLSAGCQVALSSVPTNHLPAPTLSNTPAISDSRQGSRTCH